MSDRGHTEATVAIVSIWAGLVCFFLGNWLGANHARRDAPARPAPPAVTRTCDQGYILWQTATGGITSQPNPSICATETRP
jgi:hypothetical protein